MRKMILFLMVFLGLSLHSQTLSERVLWTDTTGTALNVESRFSFDRDGNYCFSVDKDGERIAISNNAPEGNLCYAGGGYSRFGGSQEFRLCDRKDADYLYIKNAAGANIYGPIAGTVQSYGSGGTRQHLAVISVLEDTAYFYLDGKMVYSCLYRTLGEFELSDPEWADFSDNGNVIYYLEKDKRFVLYVNGQPVDSSDFEYNALSINDKGNYIYAKGFKPKKPIGKYNYMFFIHTQDTAFDYVRTTWHYALMESGAYYYSGDDNGPNYIVVNGRLHRGIESIRNITLLDGRNVLYTFEQDKQLYLNVNGVNHPVGFNDIYCPTMDTNGHYAYFGLKDYYLYKVVDGRMVKEPLSKYGVRAMPWHITPQGSTLHYFKTDDSVYVYKDDTLILEPIHRTERFWVRSWEDVLPHLYVHKRPENGHSLFCLTYGKNGYFVHDGQLSEPLPPLVKGYSWSEQKPGGVFDGVFNEHGYFAVLNTGEKKYQVVVNGRICSEIRDVDRIFSEQGYFDGRQVIFFGIRNNSICQFILTL